MDIQTSTHFDRALNNLPKALRGIALQRFRMFEQDPFDPWLKTHKLSGKLHGFYSFSIDYHHRVLFRIISRNQALFYSIGDHSIYD